MPSSDPAGAGGDDPDLIQQRRLPRQLAHAAAHTLSRATVVIVLALPPRCPNFQATNPPPTKSPGGTHNLSRSIPGDDLHDAPIDGIAASANSANSPNNTSRSVGRTAPVET